MTNNATRDDAARKVEAAVAEQRRLGKLYRTAVGTSSEQLAFVRLRDSSVELADRKIRLKSIDDGHRAGGRMWINGHEVGGTDSIFLGLEELHD